MKSEKVRVPRDVKEYVEKRRIIHIAVFATIEIFMLAVCIVFANDIFGGSDPAFSYVAVVLVMALPVWLLKIPFWMFDKTWAGEIIKKDDEEYIAVSENRTVTTGRLQVNRRQDFLIRLDSGKVIQYTVYDNRTQHAFRHNAYNVGDRVIHVGGTGYLQAVAVGDNDTLICAVCGAESRADLPVCHVCGKTLKID